MILDNLFLILPYSYSLTIFNIICLAIKIPATLGTNETDEINGEVNSIKEELEAYKNNIENEINNFKKRAVYEEKIIINGQDVHVYKVNVKYEYEDIMSMIKSEIGHTVVIMCPQNQLSQMFIYGEIDTTDYLEEEDDEQVEEKEETSSSEQTEEKESEEQNEQEEEEEEDKEEESEESEEEEEGSSSSSQSIKSSTSEE